MVLATSVITVVVNNELSPEKPEAETKPLPLPDVTVTPTEDPKRISSIEGQLAEIRKILLRDKLRLARPGGKNNDRTAPDRPPGAERNTETYVEILTRLENTQKTLIKEIKSPTKKSELALKAIVEEQHRIIEKLKDMEWLQTPMNRIDIGNIKEFDNNLFRKEEEALVKLVGDFPITVNLVTLDLEKTASTWNNRFKDNWELLMDNEKGRGVFYLHARVEDFIDHGNSYRVKSFLDDIRGKTQLVLYHDSWSGFLALYQKGRNYQHFEKYKNMIRLDIGSNHKALCACDNTEKRLKFLRSLHSRRRR
jgi:hypothetical protein